VANSKGESLVLTDEERSVLASVGADPGRDDYRVPISRGRLVYAFVVERQLASDGTIELVNIESDLTGPEA